MPKYDEFDLDVQNVKTGSGDAVASFSVDPCNTGVTCTCIPSVEIPCASHTCTGSTEIPYC